MKNVDAVAHTAAVFDLNPELDVKDYYGPAVKGTQSIFESIVNHGCVCRAVLFYLCKGAHPEYI